MVGSIGTEAVAFTTAPTQPDTPPRIRNSADETLIHSAGSIVREQATTSTDRGDRAVDVYV